MKCHDPSLGTYEDSVPNGFSDKNTLMMVITRPNPKTGSLDLGLKFPHSCDVENPSHSRLALGSGRETEWAKSLLLSLESLPVSWVLAGGLGDLCLKQKPCMDTVLHMQSNNQNGEKEQMSQF